MRKLWLDCSFRTVSAFRVNIGGGRPEGSLRNLRMGCDWSGVGINAKSCM